MLRLSVKEAVNRLNELLDRVQEDGERVEIERKGRPSAVLISCEDARLLETLEDRMDVRAAEEAQQETAPAIPLDDIEKRL